MHKFLCLFMFTVSVLSIGCQKHQYIYIKGQHFHNHPDDYIITNDSLEIRYIFTERNIPVSIQVKNKSEKPLYISWNKSAAIINGKKINYSNSSSHIYLAGITEPYANVDGMIINDENISSIPPHSYIETTRIRMQNEPYKGLPDENRQTLQMRAENGSVSVKKYKFSPKDSPLSFKSVLTLSSDENFEDEVYFKNVFWISEILESNKKLRHPTANTSYIYKKTAFGKAVGPISFFVGVTALVIYFSKN